jgi:hypothetical protein
MSCGGARARRLPSCIVCVPATEDCTPLLDPISGQSYDSGMWSGR